MQARLTGDGETALTELRKALKLDPRAAEIRAELARQLRESGRLEEALAEAQRGGRGPIATASTAHLVLAQLYQSQVATIGEDAFRKAAVEYEEVVRLAAHATATRC